MSNKLDEPLVKRPKGGGNPNWIKGGPSPNPRGRPRTGMALAERVRQKVDPDELIDLALEIARGKPIAIDFTKGDDDKMERVIVPATIPSHRDRIAALTWIRDSGFFKPAQLMATANLDPPGGDVVVSINYDALPTDKLDALLEAYDSAIEAGGAEVIDVESMEVDE